MPNQKFGTAMTRLLNPEMAQSTVPRGWIAARMPVVMPTTMISTIAAPASSRLAGTTRNNSTEMGWPLRPDVPRSPLHDVAEPHHVLHRQRLIEAQLLAQRGDDFGGALGTRQDDGEIAWNEPQKQKDGDAREDQDGDGLQHASEREDKHRSATPPCG